MLAGLDTEDASTNARAATFVATARATLRERLRQLLAASRRDLHDLDNLHRLRIAAKRLRYAMEVFAACYPREFQHERYVEVERLQEDLGDINDLRNLAATLTQMGDVLRRHPLHNVDGATGPLLRLSRDVDRELHRLRSRFLRRWTRGKQDEFCRRFERLLNGRYRRDQTGSAKLLRENDS
jgi:CHAD domain-containing protein